MRASLAKLSTGISGLDSILDGGLIADRSYVINGPHGVGKTTVGLMFLLEGLSKGERGLFITLSEPIEDIIRNASTFGWNLTGIDFLDLTPGEDYFIESKGYDIFSPSEVELGPTSSRIVTAMDLIKPRRVVIDSLTSLKLLVPEPFHYRRQLQALINFLGRRQATALLISERTPTSEDADVMFMAHGVIDLNNFTSDKLIDYRAVRVNKYRGSSYLSGQHPFRILENGVEVFPRIFLSAVGERPPTGVLSSGIPELDEMLGGGIERGTMTFISGPSGVGKTCLGMRLIKESAGRGERSIVYSFDEEIEPILIRCEGINIPARELVDRGVMTIYRIGPFQVYASEFNMMVRQEIERRGASTVMIDSFTGYLAAMPDSRVALNQIQALSVYLAKMGITALMTHEEREIVGLGSVTEVGFSYLADNVIMLRYVEIEGQIRKVISVLKKRLSDHQTTLKEYTISRYGIKVGPPITGFRGILTGTPCPGSAPGIGPRAGGA